MQILVSRTRQLVELSSVTPIDAPQLRDQDDVVILALALAANADVIITGDQDLLTLNEFVGIPIVTPKNFLSRYFFT